jgi:hypothetical protein
MALTDRCVCLKPLSASQSKIIPTGPKCFARGEGFNENHPSFRLRLFRLRLFRLRLFRLRLF